MTLQSSSVKHYASIILLDISSFGSLVFFLLVCLFILLLGKFVLLRNLLIGLAIVYAVVFVCRLVYAKQRPLLQKYSNFLEKIDSHSFPSIHTARIFLFATQLSLSINTRTVSVFLFGLALLVAYSRIALKKHDFLDVIGGTILGIAAAFLSLYF